MPWHVQHHFPVGKCAICITVWADRKVSSAERKLLPKVPLRETSTKSSEQSEAFSHFCRAFDKHFQLFFFPCKFFHQILPGRFTSQTWTRRWPVSLWVASLQPGPTSSGCVQWTRWERAGTALRPAGNDSQDLCAKGTAASGGKKCWLWMKESNNHLHNVWETEKLPFPSEGALQLAGIGDDGIWGMQEISTHGRGVLILPEYQLSRILEMMFCSCAKPQQLARAGVQPSPCHGNVTCGIHPDVTEKDGFIIFSFKCIPLLLWTKACCELELQNSWTLNGFFKMWEFDMKNIERAERNNLEGVTDTGPELLLIQACNLFKEL